MPQPIIWDKYLDRIKYTGDLNPTLENLKKLQEEHQLHIPFENLDIHYGTKITLNIPRIFHKVVENERGGFCYELNGLFYELLKYMGYQVKRISAIVHSSKTGYGKEFDHLSIVVKFGNDSYITDVGYGEFAFHPLLIQNNVIQKDPRGKFMMDKFNNNYLRISKLVEGKHKPEYIFSMKERTFVEFTEMCHYQQTSPEAHFTKKKLITRPTHDGRITISGNILKIRNGDETVETTIPDNQSFEKLLYQYFNMNTFPMPNAKGDQ